MRMISRFLSRGAGVLGLSAFLALQACPAAFAQWAAREIDQTPMGSRPNAVQISNSPAYIWYAIFFEGPGQSMYSMRLGDPAAQIMPDMATTCGPGAVIANKTLAIFYCGINGHIWVASKTLNLSLPTFDKLDIVDTGFGGITSDPSAASMDGKEIDVLYRGANGHLWQMHVSDVQHKKWTVPEDLGATIPSAPSLYVLSLDDSFKSYGLQAIFVGTNGHLWRAYWPTDTKKRLWWSGGEDLGTDVLLSAPTVDILLGTVYYLLAPPKAPSPPGFISPPGIADSFLSTDNIQVRKPEGVLIDADLAPAQTVTVAHAKFSTLLGNAVGTNLFFRDSAGHLSVVGYAVNPTVPQCGSCPPGRQCYCAPGSN
jgi:hypothetical protein